MNWQVLRQTEMSFTYVPNSGKTSRSPATATSSAHCEPAVFLERCQYLCPFHLSVYLLSHSPNSGDWEPQRSSKAGYSSNARYASSNAIYSTVLGKFACPKHLRSLSRGGLHLYLLMLAFKAGEGKQLTIHWVAYSPSTLAVRKQASGFGYRFSR